MQTILIIVALVVVAVLAFGWKFFGLGKARKYGNRIADHLGISRNLFHSILESGVGKDGMPSLMLLNGLQAVPVDRAAVRLAPSLIRGMMALESRFGPQQQIEEIKPVVTTLFVEWQAEQA